MTIYIQRFDYSGFVHKFKLLSQRNFVDKLLIFLDKVLLSIYIINKNIEPIIMRIRPPITPPNFTKPFIFSSEVSKDFNPTIGLTPRKNQPTFFSFYKNF